ncbi:MAG: DUF2892 domain-containing protein [Candidatus Nanohaloarchaea archaeon]
MESKKKFMRRLIGSMVLLGFLGGWFINEWIYLFIAFIGLNMIQSSFTDFCPPEILYERFRS